MRRPTLVLVLAGLLLTPAASTRAQAPVATPTRDTPTGAATLVTADQRPQPAIGRPPSLLTGVSLDVGAGGASGRVRVRVRATSGAEVASDWVDVGPAGGSVVLPVTPTLVASNGLGLQLDQEGGGLRIVRDADPAVSVRAYLGAPPRPTDGPPDVELPAADLALTPVYAPDADADGVADAEDRTDLAVSARARPAPGGPTSVEVTVANRGPRTADLPGVALGRGAGLAFGSFSVPCRPPFGHVAPSQAEVGCVLPQPLPPGASTTVAVPVTAARPVTLAVRVVSEGADLAPADDATTVAVGPAPLPAATLTLTGARRQRLARALRVVVGSTQAGRVVLTGTVRTPGRTLRLRRVVRFAAPGTRAVRLELTRRQAAAVRGGLRRRGTEATLLAAGLGTTEALAVRLVR